MSICCVARQLLYMMDTREDEEDETVFLTQSAFNLSVAECACNFLDILLPDDENEVSMNKERVQRSVYQPSVSGISDEDLILTCEQAESQEAKVRSSRFGLHPLLEKGCSSLEKEV